MNKRPKYTYEVIILLIIAFICLIQAGFDFFHYPDNYFFLGVIWTVNAIIWAINAAIHFYYDNKGE